MRHETQTGNGNRPRQRDAPAKLCKNEPAPVVLFKKRMYQRVKNAYRHIFPYGHEPQIRDLVFDRFLQPYKMSRRFQPAEVQRKHSDNHKHTECQTESNSTSVPTRPTRFPFQDEVHPDRRKGKLQHLSNRIDRLLYSRRAVSSAIRNTQTSTPLGKKARNQQHWPTRTYSSGGLSNSFHVTSLAFLWSRFFVCDMRAVRMFRERPTGAPPNAGVHHLWLAALPPREGRAEIRRADNRSSRAGCRRR